MESWLGGEGGCGAEAGREQRKGFAFSWKISPFTNQSSPFMIRI